MHSLESFGPMVTKLCSGQGNSDADADESNPYMLPCHATQKSEFYFNNRFNLFCTKNINREKIKLQCHCSAKSLNNFANRNAKTFLLL